ncbi:unnamed protein product [Musa acuminata subsp. burmannicoides]
MRKRQHHNIHWLFSSIISNPKRLVVRKYLKKENPVFSFGNTTWKLQQSVHESTSVWCRCCYEWKGVELMRAVLL